jgi:hypothetical protein
MVISLINLTIKSFSGCTRNWGLGREGRGWPRGLAVTCTVQVGVQKRYSLVCVTHCLYL